MVALALRNRVVGLHLCLDTTRERGLSVPTQHSSQWCTKSHRAGGRPAGNQSTITTASGRPAMV